MSPPLKIPPRRAMPTVPEAEASSNARELSAGDACSAHHVTAGENTPLLCDLESQREPSQQATESSNSSTIYTAIFGDALQRRRDLSDIPAQIPDTWQPDSYLTSVDLRDAVLVEVNVDKEKGTIEEGKTLRGYQLIGEDRTHAGTRRGIHAGLRTESDKQSKGTIVFVIRRPGCWYCRELAQAFCKVMMLYPEYFANINVIGVLKESDSDKVGLIKFCTYFWNVNGKSPPLYRDQSYAFYHALGHRFLNPLDVSWTICHVLYAFVKSILRLSWKQIGGNVTLGEGLLQGGFIGFEPVNGTPIWEYPEDFLKEIPFNNFMSTVKFMQQ